MRILPFAFVLLSLIPLGCAHQMMRGSVVMKVDEDEAHVCLGENEVKPGDKVTLYKSVCEGAGKGRRCSKVKVGEGEILELVNEHYSLARFPNNVEFAEGYIVEKR
jgi:hypothetical protein